MRFLVIAIIVLCSTFVKAQGYIPMQLDSAKWGVINSGGVLTFEYFVNKYSWKTTSDTIIDSNKYYKISHREDNFFFIREDTINKTVYIRHPSASYDTLLYKFGLNIGDSIFFSPNTLGCNTYYKVVTHVDTIDVRGQSRRRMTVHNCQFLSYEYWIEGIGSTKGLLLSLYGSEFENYIDLSCFSHKNVELFGSDSCWQWFQSVGIEEANNGLKYAAGNDILVTNSFKVEELFTDIEQLRELSLTICNMAGQVCLLDTDIKYGKAINAATLNKGLYIYTIKDNEGGIIRGKLIKAL